MKRLFVIFLLAFVLNSICSFAESKIGALTIQNGKEVELHYTLTVDGEVIDTSEGKKPLSYVHGERAIIPGLSKELEGMHAGEEKTVIVTPEEGYGMVNQNASKEVPRSTLPDTIKPEAGMLLQVRGPEGKANIVKIIEVKEDTVLIDFNHPLAGKTLTFWVKVVSIK